jgi:protein-disulfide isomerase
VKSLLNLVLLTLAFSVGCSAQTGKSGPSEVDRRIAKQVRASFNVPPSVSVTVGERKPSDFPNYETVPVTLAGNGKSNTFEFLVSKDGKTLVRFMKMDMSKDPSAETMAKIDVSGRPVRGNPDAKVTMVIYDDFQCPYCARFYGALFSPAMKPYVEQMKIVFKDYPLYEIHPWAGRAAVNALCLADQNQQAYWEFLDFTHVQQKSINEEMRKGAAPKDAKQASAAPQQPAKPNPADELLDNFAREMGRKHRLDSGTLEACVKAQDDSRVRASVKEAEQVGVNSTPTIFVNGEKLEGAVPQPELRAVLDRIFLDAGVEPPKSPAANAQNAQPNQ